MGFNIRRSKKIFPGVRLNLSKNGLGVSFGPAHSKISFSPKGRVTENLGLPGTGIRYSKRLDLKSKPTSQIPSEYHTKAAKYPLKEAVSPAETLETQANPNTSLIPTEASEGSLSEETFNGRDLTPEHIAKYVIAEAGVPSLVGGKLFDIEELKAKAKSRELAPETQIMDSYTGAKTSARELLGSYLF